MSNSIYIKRQNEAIAEFEHLNGVSFSNEERDAVVALADGYPDSDWNSYERTRYACGETLRDRQR